MTINDLPVSANEPPRFHRWPRILADLVICGGAAVIGFRAIRYWLGPNGSTEVAALHTAVIVALLSLIVLATAVSQRHRWVRPASAILIAMVIAAFLMFNLGGFIREVARAPYITLPFAADLLCGGSLDWHCARAYPQAAAGVATSLAGLVLVVAVCHGGLRRRALQLLMLGQASRAPRRQYIARAALAAVCAASAGWLAYAWEDMIEREPFLHFYFAPFETGPVELLSDRKQIWRPLNRAVGRPRPLMLITVDALRADRIGLDPAKPTLTPFLRSLATSGKLIAFEPAYAACTFSYCGLTAISASASWARMQEGPPLPMATVLAASGYRSYFLLSGIHSEAVNLARLYGKPEVLIDDADRPSARKSDDYALVTELAQLELPDPSRSFVFVHMMSSHLGGKKRGLSGAAQENAWDFVDRHLQTDSYLSTYDYGVRQADDVIRLMFAELERRGMLEDIVVAITADHAERLDPRAPMGHGGEPDLEVARVPLLIYDGRGGRYARHAIASHLDAAPTLLAAIGLPAPSSWDGAVLQRASARGAVPIDSRSRIGAAIATRRSPILYTCHWRSGEESALTGDGAPADLAFARRLAAQLPRRREAGACFGDAD